MADVADYQPGAILSLYVVTWNLEGTCGPDDCSALLQPGTHHVYVIGTEECERSIAASYVNDSKTRWEEKLAETLGAEYSVVATQTLMAIHIIMFARRDVVTHIADLQTDKVATGLLNGKVGNKGAVCISCRIGRTSLLFINAHFAAHQDNVEERNNDYHKICSGTSLRPPKAIEVTSPFHSASSTQGSSPQRGKSFTSQSTQGSKDSKASVDITECHDVVVWTGDLNYRINGLRNMVDVLLKDEAYRDVLLSNDQLILERRRGAVFLGFFEEPIQFNPTYKFHKVDGRATDEYDKSAKCRIPAWTDRVLYKTTPPFPSTNLTVTSYHSLEAEALRISDHRPVVATMSLKTEPLRAVGRSLTATADLSLQAPPSRACLIS